MTVSEHQAVAAAWRRHAVIIYLVAAYAIAWAGVWLIVSPYGFPGAADALGTVYPVAFIAMAAGPPLAGLAATLAFDGVPGLLDLFRRLTRWRVPARYYAVALLLVPATLTAALLVASTISPSFTPGLLTSTNPLGVVGLGIALGLAAGWFEEIGWTGFAIHRFLPRNGVLRTGIILGVVHGFWHLLIGYWGEGAAYGALYLPYFLLLWIVGLVALRLLIAWLYQRTDSVLIAQLAHASYTGGLMILFPTGTTPLENTLWTGGFALVLLLVVGVLCWARPRRP